MDSLKKLKNVDPCHLAGDALKAFGRVSAEGASCTKTSLEIVVKQRSAYRDPDSDDVSPRQEDVGDGSAPRIPVLRLPHHL